MNVARLSAALLACFFVASARAQAPATQPIAARPPFTVETIVRENPALRLYVAKIDLTDPRVSIVVAPGGPDPDGDGPWETVLEPTTSIARANKLDLAVNAVFFKHNGNTPKSYLPGTWASGVNMVVSEGKTLCEARGGVSILFDKHKHARIEALRAIPKDAFNLVTGSLSLVFRGQSSIRDVDEHAPRTAAGLTRDGKTLVLLVVDGRRPTWSAGMTLKDLADEMIAQGCETAINLDGGGSSTMAMRQDNDVKLVNLPSDGAQLPMGLSIERPVPYVLGIRVADNPTTQPTTQSAAPQPASQPSQRP
jgi:hypothetical protein